jgi:uncharacterized protein YfaA (DUF2138 family)
MLHRADVSDEALSLLMDRCRATFANPEADEGFTLYTYPDRNQVKYRVTASTHQAVEKYIRRGAQRLCGEINPIRLDSGNHAWDEFQLNSCRAASEARKQTRGAAKVS